MCTAPHVSLRRLLCAATVLAGLSGLHGTPAVQAQELEDALITLNKVHPQIQARRLTAQGNDNAVQGARSAYLPSLDLNGDTGYEHVNSPGRRAAASGDPYDHVTKSAGVSLSQTLYDGGIRDAALDTVKAQRDIAYLDLELTRQSVFLEAISAYLDVLRQTRLVELARQNEANIQQQLNLEDERVRRGSGIAVDVLQSKARLQVSKERRVAFEGALKDAISRFTQVFNTVPDVSAMSMPTDLDAVLPPTLEESIDLALQYSPLAASTDKLVRVASETRQTARAGYLPNFDVIAEYNYEDDVNTVVGERRDWSVVLSASWNLFDGFATRSAVRRAAKDYAAAKDNHTHTQRKVVEQVRLAWQAMETARERIELLANAENISAEVFEARQSLREAGEEDVINVLDAENEVFNARINYVTALFDAQRAAYQLLFSIGRLNLGQLQMASTQSGDTQFAMSELVGTAASGRN